MYTFECQSSCAVLQACFQQCIQPLYCEKPLTVHTYDDHMYLSLPYCAQPDKDAQRRQGVKRALVNESDDDSQTEDSTPAKKLSKPGTVALLQTPVLSEKKKSTPRYVQALYVWAMCMCASMLQVCVPWCACMWF